MPLSRRRFLGQAAPWSLLPFLPRCGEDATLLESPIFRHGVASGDPLTNGVLLWTRITPEGEGTAPVVVDWRVALDPELTQIVQQGSGVTGASVDYTLKVDVAGLDPGTTYHYQFSALGSDSPVGRTKTLPSGGLARLRIAVVSCSNYPAGYFHAYRLIAERDDLDFVVHLGDYLYEYGDGQLGDGAAIGRRVTPDHELLTLEDYRTRHAQYKQDPDLSALHQRHPVLCIWDDHEVANDAYRDGAQNHKAPAEGDYALRKAAALQAHFEWMPTRRVDESDPARIYRSVRLGDLADLLLLDTRHYAREPVARDACDPADLGDPERDLLGADQEAWLISELTRSREDGVRWRLLGQQVMLAQLTNPLLGPTCAFNPDQWDGYAASRARLLSALGANGIDNVVVLTGDIHSSWANEISDNPFDPSVYDPTTGSGSRAVELITPAVSSPGIEDPSEAAFLEELLAQTHPHVKYAELNRQGYLLLDVTHERVLAEWYHVGSVRLPEPSEALAMSLEVVSGSHRLTAAG